MPINVTAAEIAEVLRAEAIRSDNDEVQSKLLDLHHKILDGCVLARGINGVLFLVKPHAETPAEPDATNADRMDAEGISLHKIGDAWAIDGVRVVPPA